MDVVALFAARGHHHYGESVTQLAHALQAAALARAAGADDELVLAALLHDVGHLADPAAERPDSHHGLAGAALLRPFVPERLAWIIEHHVAAKRYLCAVDEAYRATLSPASVRSLRAQGEALPAAARASLEAHPWFADALLVRRWDEAAKVPDAACPPLSAYRDLLERWLGPQSWPVAPEEIA